MVNSNAPADPLRVKGGKRNFMIGRHSLEADYWPSGVPGQIRKFRPFTSPGAPTMRACRPLSIPGSGRRVFRSWATSRYKHIGVGV